MLPRWRSDTEEVGADEFYWLASYERAADEWLLHLGTMPPGGSARSLVRAPGDVFAQGRPAPGDYILVHDDGRVAWMPWAAFQAQFRRLG
jgi:hypothetical protein